MATSSGGVRISKTQRWLDLIAFLVRHRLPVDVDQVMNAVPAYRTKWNSGEETDKAAVRRMFERDKDELRDAGIPLETKEFTIDHGAETVLGYQLAARDFYLPYLRLVGSQDSESAEGKGSRKPQGGAAAIELAITGEEAATAIEALRRVAELPSSPFAKEARSALRKLGFDIDIAALGESPVVYADEMAPSEHVMREPAARFAMADTFHRDRTGTGDVSSVLRLLTRAVRERTRVRFRYHGIHRGEATDRDVAPYGLLFQHGQWYLIGHDYTRDALRVFRLGRMDPPEVRKAKAPEYEIPDDFDVYDYARRQPWELGDDEPLVAHVRFDFPLSLWAERNRHGEKVEERTGGAVIRRFQVRQTDPFLRWLQQFGGEAVVTEPAGLRQAQVDMARETLEVYGA